jgi:putative DNA primase/helicase
MTARDANDIARESGPEGLRVAWDATVARPPDVRPPEFSDDALALRFADEHKGGFRHVAAWKRWMIWTGSVWRPDDTFHVFHSARLVCRAAAVACDKKGTAKALASAKTQAAVVAIARSDPRIAATASQWDVDPDLLNTPNGVVDLRTGEVRAHRADDHMTKIAAVSPAERNADPRLWMTFLETVMPDEKTRAYLQAIAGYCLTGHTREQILFFLFGPGGNGKGVFVHTLERILADYATTASIETLLTSKYERHPADLAKLYGARLATVGETAGNRTWDEAKIKNVTGGDTITARFMRMDFFDFLPQFKLLVSGNHKPSFSSVDEGIRRRFRLIPFEVVIPEEKRDVQFEEKLRPEWPAILRWAIEGAVRWHAEGLQPPPVVSTATNEYLAAEDSFERWYEDHVDSGAFTATKDAFASWAAYCEQTKQLPGNEKSFVEAMGRKGHKPERLTVASKRSRGFKGLLVRQPDKPT